MKNMSEWYREFAEGRIIVNKKAGCKRPSVFDEIVLKVEELKLADQLYDFVRDCRTDRRISKTTVDKVLLGHIEQKKGSVVKGHDICIVIKHCLLIAQTTKNLIAKFRW